MTVKEIIELEENNKDSIFLQKEGIFWRAYNRSAMRLHKYIKSYKVNRKRIKKEKSIIYYCGFPDNALKAIKIKAKENGYEVVQSSEKQITIMNLPQNNEVYNEWKVQYDEAEPENVIFAKEPLTTYNNKEKTDTTAVIRKIRAFPLENSTPMETMLFVQELKHFCYGNL